MQPLEDRAMDAECRVLGTVMLLGRESLSKGVLPNPAAFQSDFHAEIQGHLLAAMATEDLSVDPVSVWEAVRGHRDARDFGPQHLAELVADAASPDTFATDCGLVDYYHAIGRPRDVL